MKITDVTVITASYATDDDPPTRRSFAVLKVDTDEGIVGWGEASDCYGHRHPRMVQALFDEDLRFALLGHDPRESDELMPRLWHRMHATLGAREIVSGALSAVEMALWDAAGKADGVSVGERLGRRRDSVPVYSAGKPALSGDADFHLAFLQPVLDRGATAAKIRPGRGLEWDAQFVRDMRDLLGDDVTMLVDGKYNYFPETAARLADVLGEVGAHCFEEPIIDTDLTAIAALAERSPVPLAYGEHAFGVIGFRELIEHGVGVLEPDVAVCGGFTAAAGIAWLIADSGREIVPHVGGLTAIGFAANLHFAASLAHDAWFEYDARVHQPLRDDLAAGAPFALDRIDEGRLPVPTGPGLGVEIDEEVFAAHPYLVDGELLAPFRRYGTPHL